jgi:hypothetical protein
MTHLSQLVLIFVLLLLLSVAVYVLTVRAFYWGDRDGPPKKPKRDAENHPQD